MSTVDMQLRAIELCAFGRSDPGQRRADNQDDFLIADLSGAEGGHLLRADLEPHDAGACRFALGPKGALILVADGMGGPGGSVASRLASTWIHHQLEASWRAEPENSPERFAGLLRRAVESANQHIYRQSCENSELTGMGTTTTAVGILDGYLYLGQVGDSRAYLVRQGLAIQLTRDQTMVQALVDAGTMTEQEAEESSHRTTLLQALGTSPNVSVDLTYQQVKRGDALVLCSDGLFRVTRPEEIANIVEAAPDVAAACDALIDIANSRGGPDNITAVVARLAGDGLEAPSIDDTIVRSVMMLPDS